MKLLFLIFIFCLPMLAAAAPSFEFDVGEIKHHVTADRTLYHSKEKVYEAFGHVVISSKGERLSSDYAWLDTANNELKAKGNVVFVNQRTTIQAAEIHYNLISGTGEIFYGRVSNDMYTLRGQLIRRVSTDHFLTTEGEYTTCKDCAESWKFAARDLDMTFDGYAFMSDVYVKVKDISTLYIPYLVVPVKTKRQSGFLFPRLGGGSNHGFVYIQPFFWAIDKHQDATISLGKYTLQGRREELEYRYKFAENFGGTLNYYHTKDTHYVFTNNRYAIKAQNDWSITKTAKVRWRVNEVSDKDYIYDFSEDIAGLNYPNLESNILVNAPFDDFFVSAEATRYRNLLYGAATGFDGGTVQDMPAVHFGVKERKIGPVLFNLGSRLDNFTRPNGAFQDVNKPGVYDPTQDMIREAKRLHISPEIALPVKVAGVWILSPSLQYNQNYYIFHLPKDNNVANTSTRYLRAKVESSTVIEKVYNYNGEKVNRVQHQLQPFITYSYIPWISQDATHPFNRQLLRKGGLFDEYDIVPVSNRSDYLRIPEGNSVYYGFTSRVIRHMRNASDTPLSYPYDLVKKKPKQYQEPQNKKEEIAIERDKLWEKYTPNYGDYQDIWDFSASQAYDFKDAKYYERNKENKKYAFSYLLARSDLNVDDFSHTLEYRFYPHLIVPVTESNPLPQSYNSKYSVSSSATWYLKKLTNFRGTRNFVRSFSLSYSSSNLPPQDSRTVNGEVFWSLNDYFAVNYSRGMDLIAHKLLNQSIKTIFSSPSECWAFGLRYTQDNNIGSNFGIDIGVNLFGTGYVGVNQSTAQGGSSNSFLGGH